MCVCSRENQRPACYVSSRDLRIVLQSWASRDESRSQSSTTKSHRSSRSHRFQTSHRSYTTVEGGTGGSDSSGVSSLVLSAARICKRRSYALFSDCMCFCLLMGRGAKGARVGVDRKPHLHSLNLTVSSGSARHHVKQLQALWVLISPLFFQLRPLHGKNKRHECLQCLELFKCGSAKERMVHKTDVCASGQLFLLHCDFFLQEICHDFSLAHSVRSDCSLPFTRRGRQVSINVSRPEFLTEEQTMAWL